jgi:hypothetical protein
MAKNVHIDDAIGAIRAHPRVCGVESREMNDGSGITVTAEFDTNLPSTWKANGASPTGIKAIEAVEIFFPSDFPAKAPYVSLCPDFNANLPHINPHRRGERVPPCIVYGDLLEALHSDGINRLPIQIADWLERAGENNLIDPKLGWEAMRRDQHNHLIYLDVDQLVANIPKIVGCNYSA